MGDGLHGGADGLDRLVGDIEPKNVASLNFTSHGGADDQMMMSVDVATNGDAKDQAAVLCEGPSNLVKTLTSSLDSDLEETGSCSPRKSIFCIHHYSPWAHPCTLEPCLTSITSFLNSCSLLSFVNPSLLSSLPTPFEFLPSQFSLFTSVRLEQLLLTFSREFPGISVFPIPLLHFSFPQPHNHFSIFPPFHSNVSSLVSSIIFLIKFSHPSPSHLNLNCHTEAVFSVNWSLHNDLASFAAPGCGNDGLAMIWKDSVFKGWGQDGWLAWDGQVLFSPTALIVLANGIHSDWHDCLQRQGTLSLLFSARTGGEPFHVQFFILFLILLLFTFTFCHLTFLHFSLLLSFLYICIVLFYFNCFCVGPGFTFFLHRIYNPS